MMSDWFGGDEPSSTLGDESTPGTLSAAQHADHLPAAEGFSDPSGSVTVWVEDGRINRVALSNLWRERSQTALEDRVVSACRLATTELAFATPSVDWPSFGFGAGPRRAGNLLDAPLSQDEMNRLLGETLEAFERGARLNGASEQSEIEPASPPSTFSGSSDNRRVRVELSASRQVLTVDIEADWAERVRTDRLREAVEQAFSAAYAAADRGSGAGHPARSAREEFAADLVALRQRTLRPVLRAGGWELGEETR